MKKLMRRAAAGLALPLVIGAPVVLQASPAQAAPPMVVLTPNANPSVYGQEIRVVAHAFNGEETNPVTDGSIEFVVDGVEQGPPVHLDANGLATSPPLFDEGGLPLDVTSGISDFYSVSAHFIPDPGSTFTEGNDLGAYAQTVDRAGSTLAVLPGPTSIVADLTGQLPGGVQFGSIKPTGSVTFTVGGATVGTAPIAANGRATLSYVVPPGAPRLVGASYTGDDRYTGSSDAMTRYDPEMVARLLSKFPKRSGWYAAPVEIIFACRSHGSELAEDCPLEVTLRKSGADQTVTRTVHAVDGGAATVVVAGIDIDRDDPEVSIVNGKCKATDELSGVRSCKLRPAADGEHVLAIATDRAGNRAIVRGVLD